MKHTIPKITPKLKLVYSICVAIVVTAIAYAMEHQGRELLVLPGLIIQFTINWVMLLIPTGDDYYTLPAGAHMVLNFAFYTSIIFAASVMIPLIRDSMKGERILRTKGS